MISCYFCTSYTIKISNNKKKTYQRIKSQAIQPLSSSMFESLQNLSKQSTSKIGMPTECNLCSGQRKPKLCVVWTTYPVVTLSVTWKTHFCIKIYFNYVQTLVWLNLYAAQKPNVHTKLEKNFAHLTSILPWPSFITQNVRDHSLSLVVRTRGSCLCNCLWFPIHSEYKGQLSSMIVSIMIQVLLLHK